MDPPTNTLTPEPPNSDSKNPKTPLTKVEGPCIVLAGAGTGKTRLMVEKVKHLITNNIYAPEKIACITFSNEAANNLSSRIRAALSNLEQEPIIKTFHSFSSYLLQNHLPKEKQKFHTLTPDDAKILLHTNLRVPPMNCHRFIDTIGKAKDLGVSISELKGYLKQKTNSSPEELKDSLENLQNELLRLDKDEKTKKKSLQNELTRTKDLLSLSQFIKTFEAYEKIKTQKNSLDYSDLNNQAVELLKQNPEISKEFDYIIVDEFQDTNRIQLELLQYLAPHKNITVVGDINQSIYRFRGAYEANISSFKKIFQVSKEDIFTLKKSYRSTNKVLKLAHQLIQANYSNPEETLFVENAHNTEGNKIKVIETKNGKEEARKVIELIKERLSQNQKPEEICVMARTHQQLAVIKKALHDSGIQFHAVGSESLLKQSSIKKIISYLTITSNLVNKNNSGWNAWWDLSYEELFSKDDFIKISAFLKELRSEENYNAKIFANLKNLEISQEGNTKLASILSRIKELIPLSSQPLEKIIEKSFSLLNIAEDEEIKDKEALLNINKFQEFAKTYAETHAGKLKDFVNYIEILSVLNITIEAPRIEDKGIRLMTSHSTKGLEYKTIILTNLAQKRFPIERITKNKLLPDELIKKESTPEDVEEYERKHQLFEERRLCYVSFTRSKSELILTYAQEYAGKKFAPSQFLEEINYKENPDVNFTQDLEEKSLELEPNITLLDSKEISPEIKEKTLSPSALTLFDQCQKQFEYKYVYNMPEKVTTSWDALKLGSFVHLVLEHGVKSQFQKLEQFINYSKDLHQKEEWESLDLTEALTLIRTFYERNKHKYSPNSLTEQKLFTSLSGLKFMGIADRIDFSEDGIEIVDYKTGKTTPTGKTRNWQLGYYALASKPLGKVKHLTLDVLQADRPAEYEVKDNGDVISLASNRTAFNLHEVEAELTDLGNKIKEAYKSGFKPCPVEKNCPFCQEYVY